MLSCIAPIRNSQPMISSTWKEMFCPLHCRGWVSASKRANQLLQIQKAQKGWLKNRKADDFSTVSRWGRANWGRSPLRNSSNSAVQTTASVKRSTNTENSSSLSIFPTASTATCSLKSMNSPSSSTWEEAITPTSSDLWWRSDFGSRKRPIKNRLISCGLR